MTDDMSDYKFGDLFATSGADTLGDSPTSQQSGESFVDYWGVLSSASGSPRNQIFQVKLLSTDQDLCFGQIGQGDTFCNANSAKCTVESHKKNKIELKANVSQFMIQKTDTSVLCSPVIKKSHVSSEVEDWLLKTSVPRKDDWEVMFEAINKTSPPVSLMELIK
mmetsp:Transcript_3377/g.5155  ORF Transcript_3377/g.5155 Transcript_3377/m.5155 type:complete len:164 (+) Transcript_3377:130-621(+)